MHHRHKHGLVHEVTVMRLDLDLDLGALAYEPADATLAKARAALAQPDRARGNDIPLADDRCRGLIPTPRILKF